MIKVLIVEDSLVMQELLIYSINSDPIFNIVGIANDGEEALEAVAKLKPDVIAMDWFMPKLDGKQATRKIMETHPTPIVIVTSSVTAKDVAVTFSLVEAGALAIVQKPHSVNHPEHKKDVLELNQTLKLMSEVKVVRHLNRNSQKSPRTEKTYVSKIAKSDSEIQLVAIGASTGGPIVLQKILSGLPKTYSLPVLIVQHISRGFTAGFVEWLANTSNFPVHLASDGEYTLPGHAYVAPDNFHMGIESGPRIVLSNHGLENGLKPSVAYLFRTVANILNSKSIGVLLTGMGHDGAAELKIMRDNGAITIAQDETSSVVFGMPGEAVRLGAAKYVLSPDSITKFLSELINKDVS